MVFGLLHDRRQRCSSPAVLFFFSFLIFETKQRKLFFFKYICIGRSLMELFICHHHHHQFQYHWLSSMCTTCVNLIPHMAVPSHHLASNQAISNTVNLFHGFNFPQWRPWLTRSFHHLTTVYILVVRGMIPNPLCRPPKLHHLRASALCAFVQCTKFKSKHPRQHITLRIITKVHTVYAVRWTRVRSPNDDSL